MILEETYVYLIAHLGADGQCNGPVKVGYSMSPNKRLKSLQTGNPKPLTLVFSFVTPTLGHAKDAEDTFHTVCKGHRLSGEWFDLTPKIALSTLTKCLIGHIIVDGPDRETASILMEWCGVGKAAELFASMPDEVAQ